MEIISDVVDVVVSGGDANQSGSGVGVTVEVTMAVKELLFGTGGCEVCIAAVPAFVPRCRHRSLMYHNAIPSGTNCHRDLRGKECTHRIEARRVDVMHSHLKLALIIDSLTSSSLVLSRCVGRMRRRLLQTEPGPGRRRRLRVRRSLDARREVRRREWNTQLAPTISSPAVRLIELNVSRSLRLCPRCDEEIKCSAQHDASGGLDTQACRTDASAVASGGGHVTCACTQTRRIAVYAHKVLPKRESCCGRHAGSGWKVVRTGSSPQVLPKVRRSYGADYAAEVRVMLNDPPGSLPTICAMVLVLVGLGVVARRADRATLYVDRAPPPFYPTTLRGMLALNSRLYLTALRPFNIVPGFSPYTRLQVLVLIAVAIEVNACGSLLFAGVDQCNQVRALMAALLSTACSSMLVLSLRLAFKKANRRGEGGRCATPPCTRCLRLPIPALTNYSIRSQGAEVP